LRALARRWSDDPLFQRVRDKCAFHLDRQAIEGSIRKQLAQPGPIIWKKGNAKQDRSTAFVFPYECLMNAVLPEATREPAYFGAFVQKVVDAHVGFSEWVQVLFINAVRGASSGLKLTPLASTESAGPPGLSRERLEEIAGMCECEPAGERRTAISDLLRAVERLQGMVGRLEGDPSLRGARTRTAKELRQLRGIKATAKQYLKTKALGAERRLLEMLGMDAAD
jgi:hypothetical protein